MQIILEAPDRRERKTATIRESPPGSPGTGTPGTHPRRNHPLSRRSPNRRTACQSTKSRSNPRHPPHACIASPHERTARSQQIRHPLHKRGSRTRSPLTLRTLGAFSPHPTPTNVYRQQHELCTSHSAYLPPTVNPEKC